MKRQIKKYCKEIFLCTLIFILTISAFTVGRKYNIQTSTKLDELSSSILGGLISLVAIWMSAYFILIQLYKNTYPMEIIEKEILKSGKIILLYSSFDIIIEILVIWPFDDFISQIYSLVLFVINVAIILIDSYMINRKLAIRTYIDKYFCDMKKKLNNDSIDKTDIDDIFSKYANFYNECISKDEYYVCSNIASKTNEIFCELIEKCNHFYLKGKKDLAEYTFNKIIESGVSQIKSVCADKNSSFIPGLFEQQKNNIKRCILINNYEWFELYIKKINFLAKHNKEEIILKEIYSLNMDIGIYIMENSNKENFKKFLDILYAIYLSLKLLVRKNNFDYFGKTIFYFLNECTDIEIYYILVDFLEEYTKHVTYNSEDLQGVIIYYQLYAKSLLEENDIARIEKYIEIISSEENALIEDERWNGFVLFYMNRYMEKNVELEENNRRKIFDVIMKLSIKYPNHNYCEFLPKYDTLIRKYMDDEKVCDEIIEELYNLINTAIINEKISMVHDTVNMLQKVIIELKNESGKVKEALFDVFIDILSRSIDMKNASIAEIIFCKLEDLIREMDKERYITDKFAKHILDGIVDIAMYNNKNDEKKVIMVIKLLDNLISEKKGVFFIMSNNKMKKEFYKKMYNIGVETIENNMEKALRRVSDCLGWYIIKSMKNDNTTLTNYVIDRTSDLYKIAKNMEITEKTLIFMMTLYTTVGAFCCKENKYNLYLLRIIDIIRREETDILRIKTAAELRTKENDTWDDLYDNNTQKLTTMFLNKLNSSYK